jgi:hypothetical protein
LTWYAPTDRVDGTELEGLAGFNVHHGTSYDWLHERQWIGNPSAITWTVTGLTPGTWYFAVTAVDSHGRESGLSWIAMKTIR